MSQKLSDLVRPHVGTQDGALFLEKAISPSATIPAQQVPDSFPDRSLAVESTGTTTWTPSSFNVSVGTAVGQIAAGSKYRLLFLTTPVAGCPYVASIRYIDGTGLVTVKHQMINEPSALMRTVIPDSVGSSRYRISAKSITAHLDATATTNCGMVYAGPIRNSWTRASSDTLTAGTTGKGYGNFFWRGQSNAFFINDPANITNIPVS